MTLVTNMSSKNNLVKVWRKLENLNLFRYSEQRNNWQKEFRYRQNPGLRARNELLVNTLHK